MTFLKLLWKTGINPSARSRMNLKKLSGRDKLALTSARIFGTNISGNLQSGNKQFRKKLIAAKRLIRYNVPVWNPRVILPMIMDYESQMYKADLDEARKFRYMMRGIKVGKQKGGVKVSVMNVFEKKKAETTGSEAS
jgi:small subunit ribosomal protein S33